jgi:hypothetical protein
MPLVCLVALSIPSYADTLWTLSNVVFNDGSTASGSFIVPSGVPLACPAVSYGPIYCLGPVGSFGGPTQVGNPTSWSIGTTPGSSVTTAQSFVGSGVLQSGQEGVIEIGGTWYDTGTAPESLATYYLEYDVPGLGDVGSDVEFINSAACVSDPNGTGCSVLLLTFPVSALPDLGPGSPATDIAICTQAYDPDSCGNGTVSSLSANGGDQIAYADPGELIGTYYSGTVTPEPGTNVLMLTGLAFLGLAMVRRRLARG